ncbi:helicase-related protein [Microbacterium sp. 13-71-7]|uniref:helicase-related protein n=1 Tax=Microbacterium sp. 13-71-7 TaxID=1970399 RepID=UPI0025E0CBD8|nr:helicase-related protein [Microbacterium sp. 13-71-7]
MNRGTLVEGRPDEETGLPALSWRNPPMGGFRKDPDSALVMALETFSQDTGQAQPAPILLHRVNIRPEPVAHADTPAEALSICLGETGRVDLDRIGGLLRTGDPRGALGDLVFDDGIELVPATEYLSGNVRAKLADAETRGDGRAAAALRVVVPADLGPLDVRIDLGSPLVSTADLTQFVSEVFGSYASVHHTPVTGHWEVSGGRPSAQAAVDYGTPDVSPTQLLQDALNSRVPEVTDQVWNSERGRWDNVRNFQKSAAAAEKVEVIRTRFRSWVFEDGTRAERILRTYNDLFNAYVPRTYSGAGLTFPGLSPDVTPWPHQRAAVERIVSSPRTLLAHPVGAGKTLEMLMGARTLKQFGLANKPLIVVPNHLLEQVAREAHQAFPAGLFLIATKDDLARGARRLFAARCATGEWDAVIMTHAAFGAIPVHPDSERSWLGSQKMQLRTALMSANGNAGPKAIARAIRGLEGRIGKLRSGVADADTIWFEQLGVDYIMVDEAHLYRRLSTNSTSRDNGMGAGASKRATDLLLKVETLAARRPVGAPVCALFTGTPWSNTLAETWVWQRYLQPDALESLDLLSFDAWTAMFVDYATNIEVAPDGASFRMQRRPVGIVNTPELKAMLAEVADILDPAELGLKVPSHEVRTEVVAPTPGQRAFVQDLAVRAENIRQKTADKRGTRRGEVVDDSMLLVCNDGRKVALDPCLVGLEEASAKLTRTAELIAEAYHENAARTFPGSRTPGAFQLAFLDLGTPKPGSASSYGRLRREVVARGVPAHKVRFVHEATTDKARAALFASCRDGDVALLIASTSKAGMGTNVQSRLTHLWHVDAPWLPSEVIQREGRAIRHGNHAEHVKVTRMVSEGTFDAYTWQALERKSRSFDALYATRASARNIDDISAATMSYGEVKALASGNPLLLEQANANSALARLQLMKAVHMQSVRKAEAEADSFDARAANLERRTGHLREALPDVTDDASVARLERVVAHHKARERGYPPRAPWRGLDVSLSEDAGKRISEVTLSHHYRTLHTVAIAPALARRTPQVIAEYIAETANRFVDTMALHIERNTAEAERLRGKADEARYTAATTVFPDEAALLDAAAAVGRIDALIAAEASPEPVAV